MKPPSTRETWLPALSLAALTLALYAASLPAPFVWDDEDTILRNPAIRSAWPPWSHLRESPQPGHPLLNRPLVSLSFAANHAVGGLDVRGYRAVNVALHAVSVLLLLGIARRTLERLPRESRLFQRRRQAAWLLAALWAVHPLCTEAVVYITQRTTLMAGCFLLLSLYACTRYWSSDGRRRIWLAAAVAAGAAGMASKETMVAAPVVVFLYDWAFVSGSAGRALRGHGRLHGLLASTWGILVALLVTGGSREGNAGFDVALTPWDYLTIQADVVAHYLRMALWPEGLMLSWHRTLPESPAEYLPAGLLLLALLAAGSWALRARPRVGFLVLAFFVLLAPTSSLLPIATELAAERRMYLALIPVLALGVSAWLALWPTAGWLAEVAPGLILLVPLAAAAAATHARIGVWQSAQSVWADNVRRDPGNLRARNNLGQAALAAGDLARAEEQLLAALELRPDYAIARHNLALVRREQGRLDEAQELLARAVVDSPGQAESVLLLASVACQRERCDEALEPLARAARLLPGDPAPRVALARVYRQQGRPLDAERRLREALAVDPGHGTAYAELADLLVEQGLVEEAVAVLRLYAASAPLEARAHRRLGALLAASGRLDEGILHLRRATVLAPGDALAHHNLGVALVEKRCFVEATRALALAVRLDPTRSESLSALAQAQRAAERGEDAHAC